MLLLGATLLGQIVGAQALTNPALPAEYLNTTYVAPSGQVTYVPVGGDFQAALSAAQPGSVIELQAGATFTGNFTLPAKSGSGWIYIRSSAHASLPAPGSRVFPTMSALMPKIVSPNTAPAIATAAGAHHYRFIGIEITTTHAVTTTTNYNLVDLTAAGGQNSLSQIPTDIIFDRCYLHGTATGNVRRGIALNSARSAVIDSYLSNFHEVGSDSQAIAGWNGPGPFKIVNNYLEGAGENLMFGGNDPSITNLVPSDIEIRNNHFYKPFSWRIEDPGYAGIPWSVKNILELKNARRVLIDGNILEHNWAHAQNGFAVLFTVRNQDGTAPWSVVEDVTFTNNIVRYTGSAINILGLDNFQTSQQTKRIVIKNNLFDLVGGVWGAGRLFQLLNGTADVVIEHNTGLQTGEIIIAADTANTNFVYRNNLTPNNLYGVGGDGTFGNPNLTLSTFFPGAVFTKNVLVGGNPSSYPVDNFFPTTLANVGFVNLATSDYRLAGTSAYKGAGTDGMDIGVDMDVLTAMTAGVISGTLSSGGTPPPDTTAPTVAIASPASGSAVSGSVTVSANAADNVGVAGVQFRLDGTNLGAEVTAAPYSVSWNTTTATVGTHTLTAIARDAAGNVTTSNAVTVTIAGDTTAPILSAIVTMNVTASGATIAWTTSEPSDSQVEYGLTNAYGSTTPLDTTLLGVHAVTLSALTPGGLYHYRVKSRDAAGNLAVSGNLNFTTAAATTTTQSPYQTAFGVPGLIEAENFDNGGEGVAYHDLTAGNTGGLHRPNESVDIAASGTGYVVNNFQTGEWLEYTISVAQAGPYRLEALVSSEFTTSRWHAEIDGVNVTGSITNPSTGSWRTFQWVGKSGINLAAGTHVLRVYADAEYFNLDAIRFAASNVVWTNLANVTATGGSLKKTAGCDGCQDAGPISEQQIASGNGYVEFTISETASQRVIGLSRGNTDTSKGDIDFGFQFWPGGTFDVRENDAYKTESSYAVGDIFRIAVESGVVRYSKNGVAFYASAVAPAYPLLVDTVFLSAGGTITNAVISTGP